MEIRRTANAGVLLTLDDVKILLDGVCREVEPYPATPPEIRQELLSSPPDAVLFTHNHEDHFDPAYCQAVKRPVLATAQTTQELSGVELLPNEVTIGKLRVIAVPTRHMGHYGKTTEHQSYIVQGSRTVWFLGDASPTELRKLAAFPKPDVLMIPYPYISTPAAIKMVETYLPCKIVLLHMPLSENDPEGIWESAAEGMEHLKAYLYVPQMGETMKI